MQMILRAFDTVLVELEEVREIFERELSTDEPAIADIIEQVGKCRGKMLRPALVLLCGKLCGPIKQSHRIIATVVEMLHMATLIHDDVLDEAEHRRRGKTINALHGNEAAVLLGDLLLSHAFSLCSQLEGNQAARLLSATTNILCEGELLQLIHRGYYELTEERYLEIISRKTASLIAVSCLLGAQESGADAQTAQAIEKFGNNMGMAFQIMDDIMDLTGDEAVQGKTLGTDLVKEKLTLPVIHYLRSSDSSERKRVEQLLMEKRGSEYERFKKQLISSGSIDYARRRGREFVEKAQQALLEVPATQERELLEDLAISLIA